MRFDAELRGLKTLPRSILSMMDSNEVRLTLVMTLIFGQVLRMYMPTRTFFLIDAGERRDGVGRLMPHLRKNASFVPSPQRIPALGRAMESSSQRA